MSLGIIKDILRHAVCDAGIHTIPIIVSTDAMIGMMIDGHGLGLCPCPYIIGEREQANLVVQTFGIFHLYIYIYIFRTSSNCACVTITRFFLYENMKFFFYPMSILMLSRQEACVEERGGETIMYTCANPGLVFIIAYCSRARPV